MTITVRFFASLREAVGEPLLEISRRFDYPLHLGVTHAGPKETGTIRSVVALGTLLAEGIGDTIRVSLTDEPYKEVEVGKEILRSLGLASSSNSKTCFRTP